MCVSTMDTRSVQDHLARVTVAYIKQSDYVAKAKYLDALRENGKGYGTAKRYVEVCVCKHCHLPELPIDTPSFIPQCTSCGRGMNCKSPYCVSVINNRTLQCLACKKQGFCTSCITAGGCVFCGKICCRSCALVGDETLTICSAECAKDTAKEHNRVAKRAKVALE